jgi:hypothetical protein
MSTLGADPNLRTYIRPVLVALVAGGSYGAWAAFACHRFGAGAALLAGGTQVALSVTATLVLALVLERLFRLPSTPVRGFWLAWLGTSALALTWLVVGHALAGTPRIFVAITPSAIVGTVGYFVYARLLLARAGRRADSAESP